MHIHVPFHEPSYQADDSELVQFDRKHFYKVKDEKIEHTCTYIIKFGYLNINEHTNSTCQ